MTTTPSALVIGGASGIGAAVADQYRSRGIAVLVWDVQSPCDIHCDVGDPDSIDRAVRATVERTGVPRWVTITAGIGHSGLLGDLDPGDWDRVMQVNARGPWLCMRALAAAMAEAGQPGSMVATSSVSAHLVDRNMGAYCASKAALNMLVRVAAAEWGGQGIRVNAVAPGVTMTPILSRSPGTSPWLDDVAGRTALERLGQASDIAQAIASLHEMAWVTGQIVDCDGGLSMYSPINSYAERLRGREDRPR